MRFEGRRVLVTGASRGIGRGIVDAFLEEGATVFATDVLEAELRRLSEAHPAADRLHVHTADLADARAAAAIVPTTVEALGGLDVVVNNAGVQPDGRALDVEARGLRPDLRRERPGADAADAGGMPLLDRARHVGLDRERRERERLPERVAGVRVQRLEGRARLADERIRARDGAPGDPRELRGARRDDHARGRGRPRRRPAGARAGAALSWERSRCVARRPGATRRWPCCSSRPTTPPS